MDASYLDTAVKAMAARGVQFAKGLDAVEIETAEVTHGFRFPRTFVRSSNTHSQSAERFPDWRRPDSQLILDKLAWPAEGICFDVEHSDFWLSAWGPRPAALAAAQARAREAVGAAPFLIPIYSHRYLPALPCEAGNPVFSVYQTDIIHYGLDLRSYLFGEFGVPNPAPVPDAPREIELWSELVRLN